MSTQTRTWTHADVLRAVDRLDFTRICTAMTALGWRWVSVHSQGVPTEGEVRRRAIELANDALQAYAEGDAWRVRHECGGLVASVSASEIRVEFVLSSGTVEQESQ